MINEKNVLSGGFHIQPGFLSNNEFNDLNDKIKNLDYIETHQPSNLQLGNRFQGYPCYEKNDDSITKLMYSKVKNLFERDLQSFQCIVRKVVGEELKMSKVNTQYGIVHSDNENPTFASVLQFDQTTNGGTAFFENSWDKHPDIIVGSYPNRLLIYNGCRHHAPMYDFTYKQRYVIASFWY